MSLPFKPSEVRRVFVSFSGGKDSLASLLLTLKLFPRPQVEALFADTGAELPATYTYLRWFNASVFPVKRLAQRIVGVHKTARGEENVLDLVQLQWDEPVGARGALTMGDLVRQRHRRRPDAAGWPSAANRYCTKALKQQVLQKYVRAAVPDVTLRKRCLQVIGLRHEESKSRASTPDFAFDYDLLIQTWYPVVDWSRQDVLRYVAAWGIPLNPVYAVVSRTACGMCFFGRAREVVEAERAYPEYLTPYVRVESEIGYTWAVDRSLALLQSVARGEIPDQVPLFDLPAAEPLSCLSGLCEVW
jgi:3'-phosphoadenosine 5'-phosphosulfate sulfotransferase (PAPS reductase)/FAD synthetase